MATTFLLGRHAAHDLLGKVLTGRTPGVLLGDTGLQQAAQLAQRLRHMRLSSIQASPLERAQQTAAIIAAPHGLTVEAVEALNEVDFGAWNGMRFTQLDAAPAWHRWNSHRASSRCPGGESMGDVQQRFLGHMRRMCDDHPRGCLVLVSHCDPIKAVLLHALGGSLDEVHGFDLAPASISTVVMDRRTLTVVGVNQSMAA